MPTSIAASSTRPWSRARPTSGATRRRPRRGRSIAPPSTPSTARGSRPRRRRQAVADLLDTPTSRYLRDLVAHDRIYRELILTDREGRLVAASNLPSDYFQGDEDWWTATRDDGRRGRVTVTDVRWDDSARIYAVEIAVPVPAPGSEDLAGVLKAVTDSREMLALVGSVQLGDTGTSWLLRRNGSVVFSRHPVQPGTRFWAADLVKARMDALQQSGSIGGASFEAQGADGTPQIVGLAESQLATSYPNVAWVIAVGQARDELLAPVRVVGWYLLLLVAAAAIIVLALALWVSFELAAPQVDVDMHLVQHPSVSHVGELSAESPGRAGGVAATRRPGLQGRAGRHRSVHPATRAAQRTSTLAATTGSAPTSTP